MGTSGAYPHLRQAILKKIVTESNLERFAKRFRGDIHKYPTDFKPRTWERELAVVAHFPGGPRRFFNSVIEEARIRSLKKRPSSLKSCLEACVRTKRR